MNQTYRVLKAVKAGCATSVECSAATDLSAKYCFGCLQSLEKRGLIRRVGTRRFPGYIRPVVEWKAI